MENGRAETALRGCIVAALAIFTAAAPGEAQVPAPCGASEGRVALEAPDLREVPAPRPLLERARPTPLEAALTDGIPPAPVLALALRPGNAGAGEPWRDGIRRPALRPVDFPAPEPPEIPLRYTGLLPVDGGTDRGERPAGRSL